MTFGIAISYDENGGLLQTYHGDLEGDIEGSSVYGDLPEGVEEMNEEKVNEMTSELNSYTEFSERGDAITLTYRQAGDMDVFAFGIKGQGARGRTENQVGYFFSDGEDAIEHIQEVQEELMPDWSYSENSSAPHPLTEGIESLEPEVDLTGRLIQMPKSQYKTALAIIRSQTQNDDIESMAVVNKQYAVPKAAEKVDTVFQLTNNDSGNYDLESSAQNIREHRKKKKQERMKRRQEETEPDDSGAFGWVRDRLS